MHCIKMSFIVFEPEAERQLDEIKKTFLGDHRQKKFSHVLYRNQKLKLEKGKDNLGNVILLGQASSEINPEKLKTEKVS